MRGVSKCGLFVASLLVAAPCLSPPVAGTKAARAVQSSSQSQTQAQRDAAALYSKHCATCHGKDGRAKTFKARLNGARDLTDAAWHDSASDERLFNSVMNGRGKMPSFKKKLSPAEVESLVRVVRTLKREPKRAIGERRAPE
ncbi:MAG TPA: cytochrome c [Pyrinomonadaceae bacterium]|nr:cytochrome c [Pyrinomonadaceae bacterium]